MKKLPFLKHLESVGLPNTKIIQISYANIRSLEALCFLDCPMIEELRSYRTNSSDLKPLQKLNSPYLK